MCQEKLQRSVSHHAPICLQACLILKAFPTSDLNGLSKFFVR
jgi:hypothetical protein